MSGQKTYDYLTDYVYWPTMQKDTMEYCQQCDTCQHTKFSTQAPQGLARPLPIPQKPFTHFCMDFLSMPPKIGKYGNQEVQYDSIWVIVDRFSALKKLIPVQKTTTSEQLCIIFMKAVYPEWGMPDDIVSDRDSRFTAKPWTNVCKDNQIHQSLSSVYHPRTVKASPR